MADSKSAVEQFGPVAAEYAAFSYHRAGPDLAPMLAAGALRGHERVLDIGSGPGHTALLFAPHVREVVALDPSAEMLREGAQLAAERSLSNVRFEQASAEAIPFGDRVFDRVTSRQSAHHYSDVGAALREVARVMSEDGSFVLVDTFAPEERELDAFLNRVEGLRDPSHVRDYSVSEWRRMFASVGFELEDLQRWRIALDFGDWVARSKTAEAEVAALRRVFAEASPSARSQFEIAPSCDWSVPVGLVVGRRVR